MPTLNDFNNTEIMSQRGQSSEGTAVNSLLCVIRGFVLFLERADHIDFIFSHETRSSSLVFC